MLVTGVSRGIGHARAQELPRGMCCVALSPAAIDTDMLRPCWAEGSSSREKPEAWARKAVPFQLTPGPQENGNSLQIPSGAR